jgi:hypothetical protein
MAKLKIYPLTERRGSSRPPFFEVFFKIWVILKAQQKWFPTINMLPVSLLIQSLNDDLKR